MTDTEPLEAWRKVWREGVAPLLSTASLHALQAALIGDDARLLQGKTTEPLAVAAYADWPVESACAVSFCGWQAEGLETVAEVDEFFARMCFQIDQRVNEPAGCRHFFQFWDESPRAVAVAELLSEVNRTLAERPKHKEEHALEQAS